VSLSCPVACPVACPVTCPVACPVTCPVACPVVIRREIAFSQHEAHVLGEMEHAKKVSS
jgi:hypothetical protein